jgi:sensor histidine kinase YesM
MCLIVGVVIYAVLNNYLLETQLTSQTRIAEALCRAITTWKKDYEKLSLNIISDPQVQRYLRNEVNTVSADLNRILGEYAEEFGGSCLVYVMSRELAVTGTGANDITSYIFDRISTAERNNGGVVWDIGYDPNYVILYRKINDQKYNVNAMIGYLFIAVAKADLLKLFDDYRLDSTQRFTLSGAMNGFEVSERGFYYGYYDNYTDLLHSEITFDDWRLRTWINKIVVLAPMRALFFILFIVLSGMVVVAIVIILILSTNISKQVLHLTHTITKYGSGDFTVRAPVVQQDETGRLAEAFNRMAEQIQDLIYAVKLNERQKRKLHLQTLEYQINPHFLYNTLNSINMLARKNGDIIVGNMVTDLSRMFQFGLHQGQEIVSVSDEVKHLYYFLSIQSVRFEDQLTWTLEIDPEIENVRMIKFVLQPLAENAINHGIRPRTTPGKLTVSGCRDNDTLIFTLCDNGIGIDDVTLNTIREVLLKEIDDSDGDGTCFGLWNISQRIKLLYGAGEYLFIESTAGVGTKVTLKLPAVLTEDMSHNI